MPRDGSVKEGAVVEAANVMGSRPEERRKEASSNSRVSGGVPSPHSAWVSKQPVEFCRRESAGREGAMPTSAFSRAEPAPFVWQPIPFMAFLNRTTNTGEEEDEEEGEFLDFSGSIDRR